MDPNLRQVMFSGRRLNGSLKLPLSLRCVRRGMWLLLKLSGTASSGEKRIRRWVMEAGMLSSDCEKREQRDPSVRWVSVAGR